VPATASDRAANSGFDRHAAITMPGDPTPQDIAAAAWHGSIRAQRKRQ
jgi:hypothetical protein